MTERDLRAPSARAGGAHAVRDVGDGERGDGARGNGPRSTAAYEFVTGEDYAAWLARTRVVLSPIAAPSILGLFAFMGATLMVGAWQAGWYGTATTPLVLFPFALFFGGVAQLIAGFFAFRARDGVAVAAHGTWGSFWIAWGILQLLVATGVQPAIPLGVRNTSFAFWFIALAAITMMAALAALAQNILIAGVLATLAAGSALTAAGFWGGFLTVTRIGGWLFVVSSAIAWLAASAMMLENAFGRTILPLGKYSRAANAPGGVATRPLQYPAGMPGVRVGQ